MAESLAGRVAEVEPPKDFTTVSEETGSVGFKAIVLGATGATGCYVVGELLTSKVTAYIFKGLMQTSHQ